ncbi:hypothetical protein STEG23_036452, partial [Scotinomys teguina]
MGHEKPESPFVKKSFVNDGSTLESKKGNIADESGGIHPLKGPWCCGKEGNRPQGKLRSSEPDNGKPGHRMWTCSQCKIDS